MRYRVFVSSALALALAAAGAVLIGRDDGLDIEAADGGPQCGLLVGGVRLCAPCDAADEDDTPCGSWQFVTTEDGGVAAPVCVEVDGVCLDGGR